VIPHATARAIGSLMIAVVEASFRALAMTAAGRADRAPTPLSPAALRAVGVAAITGDANREGLRTRPARAQPERDVHQAVAPSTRPWNDKTLVRRATMALGKATGCVVESATRIRSANSGSSPRLSPRVPYRKAPADAMDADAAMDAQTASTAAWKSRSRTRDSHSAHSDSLFRSEEQKTEEKHRYLDPRRDSRGFR
jgi:hypothetical protein